MSLMFSILRAFLDHWKESIISYWEQGKAIQKIIKHKEEKECRTLMK